MDLECGGFRIYMYGLFCHLLHGGAADSNPSGSGVSCQGRLAFSLASYVRLLLWPWVLLMGSEMDYMPDLSGGWQVFPGI